ncbi:TetR/AcrR family transcriptional regulator [Halalkalibacterium halodurans]|uniref:Transcriptional regulator (TetR/AcrR family) n=1 Tax=Halalkalibacterium halodurans (strain ATCC BAA-125 / DSM 18197 / FERM 7344 / JCM 9153 / C-125) TaxID=272558 RepID=Q9KE70_HALH5|nr:TetR/AcrR family transcriptional regulator [Halalkalibacterium halodurans]MDY7221525.1 TetR/AcrR family transcriptional regulator [Halalkalibacterium halodurans]MDY7240801.1 TetR/AcrR family transcriptional regulator [Halalkalibacterium halodurans]MED4080456.1 TetR/AcrR family transcriptional regulator [Halalkalibacterium halodurans]MED4086531.1 TetR/AcrR family transcriptional regulator [Halalkalibacterium halodurans]MED4104760.1 TetR/AcrR family transcriptional regulator [Halalkalibacteri
MARTKEQNERMSMATREKIYKAALSLFAHKGFALTTIKDISREAHISTGLVYRHFHSKEELFGRLIEKAIGEMTSVTKFLETDTSPKELVSEFVTKMIAGIQSSEEVSHYFLLVARSLLEDEVLPKIGDLKKTDLALFQQMAELIARGQRQGEFKEGDSYKLSLLLFSIIQGMANMKMFMGEKYVAPDLQDVTAFLFTQESPY